MAKKAILPPEYKDEDAFIAEARARFEDAMAYDNENRLAGQDDLKFVAGEQWDDRVKKARQTAGRPCLTINTLPQFIGQVIGDMRQNRPSIRIRPAEDGDKKVAEVRQGLIRFIENNCNALSQYAMAGEDQVACGIGNFRVVLEYAGDDSFDQDIRIAHIPNPFSVVWDPLSVEPTGKDAQFCFVTDDMPRKQFDRLYPGVAETDLKVPNVQVGWISQDIVRVTEYWIVKETKRKIALVQQVPEAQPQIIDVTENIESVAPFIVRDASGAPRVREAVRKTACMYLINGARILDGPFELPISRIPIFRVTGREIRVGDKRYRFGLIRFAKDSARIKNLMRSAAMEWVAMAPKQQWLLHASDENEAERYRAAGRSGDTVLVYSGQVPPQRIDPPSSPAALLAEAQFNDQDIKDVTGLHDASLGMRSNETSGKAILARERQGDTATFMYHDNLNGAIREAGRVINELIPVVFDTARTIVVLGEDDSSQAHRINDPNHPEAIDLKVGKYDVVVETGPSYSTKRVEAAESMMQFVQAIPSAAAVAGDLIAKSQDWPMADEIAERLRGALPPGMVKPKPGEEQPPPDPMQMQAMQMQQEAQQIQMTEQQAKARKAVAEAHKAEAEAQLAQLEVIEKQAMHGVAQGIASGDLPPDAIAA